MPELTGAELIAAERKRQIEEEGWDEQHDDQWAIDALAEAGACYALAAHYRDDLASADAVPVLFRLGPEWWKPTPTDRVKELVKAGALIAAEIDQILR